MRYRMTDITPRSNMAVMKVVVVLVVVVVVVLTVVVVVIAFEPRCQPKRRVIGAPKEARSIFA